MFESVLLVTKHFMLVQLSVYNQDRKKTSCIITAYLHDDYQMERMQ